MASWIERKTTTQWMWRSRVLRRFAGFSCATGGRRATKTAEIAAVSLKSFPMRIARVMATLVVAAWIAAHHHQELAAQRGSTALLSQLTWFDRGGKELGTVGPLANHG